MAFKLQDLTRENSLQKVTDFSLEDFKFRDAHTILVGSIPCLVQRVSYTGDLGFEIYCGPRQTVRPLGGVMECWCGV